jgi:hypothetical protein
MFAGQQDEMTKGPHSEPDEDIDSIMSQDITSPEDNPDDLFGSDGSPLASALEGAGYNATPEQLTQIESILGKPGAATPSLGAKKPAMPMPGGAVPGAMESGDIPQR